MVVVSTMYQLVMSMYCNVKRLINRFQKERAGEAHGYENVRFICHVIWALRHDRTSTNSVVAAEREGSCR